MLRRRAEIGFLQRPVIEPDDRIQAPVAACGDAERPPSLSRTTSEQVASKPIAPTESAATPACSTALRTAMQTADQISSESCSA